MGDPLRPEDPSQLGRFRLIERLGEGGQGIVYLGEDPNNNRRVAVKVLKTGADAEARARLAHEMAAAQRVRPFCTARVIDFSFDGARPFIVSEFIDGPSLYNHVLDNGPMRDGELERLLVNTATALVAIHRARIVHRDLKPANVLLGRDGPRVVDFGIAKPGDQHTHTGQLIGTPSYFSPEQLNGAKATYASDVFAWAGTMVFAAGGHPPFGPFPQDGDNIAVILGRIMHAEPNLSEIPSEWLPLLRRCLDKDPAQRPTAREVYDALVDSDLDVDVPPVPAPELTPPPMAQRQMPPHLGRDITQLPVAEPAAPVPYFLNPMGSEPTGPRHSETVPPFQQPPGFPPLETTPPPFVPSATTPPRRKRRTGRMLVVLILLAAVAGTGWFLSGRKSPTDSGGVPQKYAGTWAGKVQLTNGVNVDSYDTTITLSGSRIGGVEIPYLTCNQALNLKSAEDNQLTFSLDGGSQACPIGDVVLSLDGVTLNFHLAGRAGNYQTGSGSLKKVPQNAQPTG
jgi:serine/threonine protein kinase